MTDSRRGRRVPRSAGARRLLDTLAGFASYDPSPRTSPNYAARRAMVVAVVVGGVALAAPLVASGPSIDIEGVTEGAAFGVDASKGIEIRIAVVPTSALDDAVVEWNDVRLDFTREDDQLVWRAGPDGLDEGQHVVTVRTGRRLLWRGPTNASVSFVVDGTNPDIDLVSTDEAHPADKPLTVRGTTEPGSSVQVDGVAADVDGAGGFRVTLPFPPIGHMNVTAVDAAGNRSSSSHPTGVSLPSVRAVHMSALSWTVSSLRQPVLDMAERGQINAIQLDLKDESGDIGHRTQVARANEIGASSELYDLSDVVEEIHAKGLRVVGRLVVFRDPKLVEAAIAEGALDEVVQTADGAPYRGGYGGFANPASAAVTDYNLELAVEAAEAGVDDILFDYIRRPEGSLDGMLFPGAEGPVEDAIIAFLDTVGDGLSGTPTRVGVSVFGIAARNPEQIAQPIDRMAREVDYIAPMVYPSHWSAGWYGVDNPDSQPYDIVLASLRDFQEKVAGTDAKIVPWLQDFDLGSRYGDNEVREQIRAAGDAGITDWLMWDPNVTYHPGGIPTP